MAAIIELYANNAYSTLASSTTTSATTLTVVNGSSFPSPVSGKEFFRMTITGASSPNTVIEIVYVTARSGNTMTVIRGQEGTSGVAWSLNDLCANEATAGTYNQFVQPYTGVDTGSTNAYVVSTPQHESAYYTGMPVVFYTLNANTITAPTLNLNGIGARTIQNADGSSLVAGQIPANTPVFLMYNSVDATWRLQSPIGFQQLITGGASSIVSSNLLALKALISDSSGKVGASVTTSQELSRLAGVTSSVQNQINDRTKYTDFIYQTGIYIPAYNTYNNGYMIFPGGFKIVWIEMRTFTTSAGGALVTLPSTFTTSAACWQATSANGGGNPTAVGIGPNSTLSRADVRWAANTIGAFIMVMGI